MKFAAAFLALAALVSAAPCPGYAVVKSNCQNSGQVALTFDVPHCSKGAHLPLLYSELTADGPWAYDLDIARDLNGGKATFFLNGNNYGCIYDRVDDIRSLYAQGHTLGSHTWSHADVTTLSYDQINQELERVEQAFIKILGVKPLYFRPPYGSINDLAIQVLSDRGYRKILLWDVDAQDASGGSVQDAKNALQGAIDSYPSPHMVLQHSTIPETSQIVVPWAVPKFQSKGYQLVTVDTCLGSEGEWPYQWVGNPGTPDGSWHC